MHSTDGGYTVWGSTLHIDIDNVSIHLIIGIFIGVPIYSCTVPHTHTHTQNLFLFIACSTLACNACIVFVFASGCWRKRMWMIYDLVTIYTEDMFCPWAFGRYHWQRGDSGKALAYSVSCSIHLNVWREDPATGISFIVRCICFVVRGGDGLCGARRCIFQCRGALFWMYQFDVVARRWVFKIGDPHCTLTIGSLSWL